MQLETTDSLESKGEGSSLEMTEDSSSQTSSVPEGIKPELTMLELSDKHNLLLPESL